MSHLSKVQVEIKDIDVLREALNNLGLRCIGEVDKNYEFAENFNQCDVLAVNAVNRVLGFRFKDGVAEMRTNLEPEDFEKTKNMLMQNYSVLLLKKSVAEEGKFQVQGQETLPDGTIKITVGRWV